MMQDLTQIRDGPLGIVGAALAISVVIFALFGWVVWRRSVRIKAQRARDMDAYSQGDL